MAKHQRIAALNLDEKSVIRRTPEVEHERAIAIADLLEENYFAPKELAEGPFELFLSITDNRMTLHIKSQADEQDTKITLSIRPFARIIKDYFMICETYFDAIKHANPSKIEAIDMGRRGIHNEGSDLLESMLREKVRLDFETARRLFTLICVLHIK